MPKVNDEELPGTIRRSPEKARRTYAKTLASAHREYGDEERAHRTAYASLERNFEKVGDHWEPGSPRGRWGRTAGGVDVEGHSKKELYDRARDLDVAGRSRMTKMELAEAIARRQD